MRLSIETNIDIDIRAISHSKMITNEAESLTEEKNNESAPPEMRLRDAIPQILASCAINLTVIQAGINMAFSSILIPQLSLPESDIQIDLDSSSTVASIVTLSIASGALVCGPLMDKLGRRFVTIIQVQPVSALTQAHTSFRRLSTIICAPFIFGWLLIGLSRNLYMIYVARVLSGFCGGLYFIQCHKVLYAYLFMINGHNHNTFTFQWGALLLSSTVSLSFSRSESSLCACKIESELIEKQSLSSGTSYLARGNCAKLYKVNTPDLISYYIRYIIEL